MSDVLIKGMKMPKDNPVTINIYRDGSWVNAYTKENGEAIEVPPHGRLIDADALTAKFKEIGLGDHSLIERLFADGVYAMIDCAPTIIPADPEEEEMK